MEAMMKKRESRRDRDWHYGARARRTHLRVVHPDGKVDCICDQSVWYFRKRKSLGCSCRRKHKGNPKIARGMCHGCGCYHPSVVERIAGNRLTRNWMKWVRKNDPMDAEF